MTLIPLSKAVSPVDDASAFLARALYCSLKSEFQEKRYKKSLKILNKKSLFGLRLDFLFL